MADDGARFEVLEEQTHFPASHPQRQQAERQSQELETLEQRLAALALEAKDAPEDAERAAAAKELGNACVAKSEGKRLRHQRS